MMLKDIVGQERALHILRGFLKTRRIPHALLFAGDDGIGKRLTALMFAKALNCRKAETTESEVLNAIGTESAGCQGQFDACDECPSCHKIDRGNHPDVNIMAPEGDGGQITVAAVRKLQESLSFKPFEGSWKVAIIDEADRLNQSAANAFLQTLEEPSSRSILMLVSSKPDVLLPTIRSRSQRINFTPLPPAMMSRLIQERSGEFEYEQAKLLSVLSGGRPGYALSEDLIERRNWSFDILWNLLGKCEEEVWTSRNEMEEWFDWAQLLLRDISVYRATGRTDLLVNVDREKEIKAVGEKTSLKDLLILAREFYNIRRRLYFNLNKQLTMNYTSLLLKRSIGKTENRGTR